MVGDAVAVIPLDLDDALFDRPPGTHEPSQFLSDGRQIGRRNTGHEGDGLALTPGLGTGHPHDAV